MNAFSTVTCWSSAKPTSSAIGSSTSRRLASLGRCVKCSTLRILTAVRAFRQVDVFGSTPFGGNPVAVVLDAEGLSTEEMQRIANWTNLSETTFVLPPTQPGADYRVRIFTTDVELPFAGHPTLGTAHAWHTEPGTYVQECGAGLIDVRVGDGEAAFAAPPLRRDGPVEAELAAEVRRVLGVEAVVDMKWCENGPPWVGVLLDGRGRGARAAARAEPARHRGRRGRAVPPTGRSAASSTGRRTPSPAPSTRRSRSGCSVPAGRPRPTSPRRGRRSAAPAACT